MNSQESKKANNISNKEDSSPLLVTEFMTRGVLSIHKDETAQTAASKMVDLGVASFIVSDDEDRTIGIVTEKDLVGKVVASNVKPSEISVMGIMSSPMKKLPVTTTINEAIEVMNSHGIKHMVIYEILETGERVVGMLSQTNLVQADLSLNNLITY